MQDTKSNNYLDNKLQNKFFFVEKISELKKNKNLAQLELCVIKTDFDKNDLKLIKKIVATTPSVEFWISSNESSRKNVLCANEMGVKMIVSSPFDMNLVLDFFKQQDIAYLTDHLTSISEYSSLAGLKIMIVDDNLMNVTLLEEILSPFDLEISTFLKPQEACATAINEEFDMFLLDIMMPEMSGFDLAKIIKGSDNNQNAPIIFISALSDSANKITGYNLGSHAYIEKPFDVNIVKSQIYNVLKNQKIKDALVSEKENFMATVAHDLKTPISAEINALKLLLGEGLGTLAESQQEIIEDILNSTKFMKDMVENILCKNKIDCGQINLVKEMCSLTELVECAIDLTKYILSEKQQMIRFRCELQNPMAAVDFLEMKRVLHNLIANASAYSPCGKDIIIEVFQQDDCIGLFVQDFGKGIDLKNQEEVFVQFMSMAKQNKTVGTGLGLYITKRIVEAHGGRILLDSKVGSGTKISILLPMNTNDF